MNFLFINKPFFIEPLGIMYLSSQIRAEGHNSKIITSDENLESRVKEYNPDFIGYSIMTGDQDFYDKINSKLKNKLDFFSIAGGPHPTFFPELIEKSSFDAICRGEGENAIKKLLKNPNSKKINNFWFKDNGEIIFNEVDPLIKNLDEIIFPDRDLVFKYPSIKEGPIKHFIASRGCPYDCTYCFNESFSKLYEGKGKRVRFRSVDNLLDEVEEVVSNSPTKVIYFQDDTFILDKSWLKEFSEKYSKRINLPYHCHTRANLVDKDVVDNLKKSSCYSVHIAAESGNDSVRKKVLNRRMSNEQIFSAVKLFKSTGIKTMLQNILGLPFTSLKNDLETLELNIKCQPDYAWASVFQPYPKTKLGERCVKEGIYKGDFSDIGSNFFDQSVLEIKNKNEILNLQKLFALTVENPSLYTSGILNKLIELPYESTKEKFTELYKNFRKKSDKILYGIEL